MISPQIIEEAQEGFRERFREDPLWVAASPGRVNLIGEHVDYNDGLVLPMAIQRHLIFCASPSDGMTVRLDAYEDFAPAEFEIDDDLQPGEPAWTNYVRGVIAGFRDRDVPVTGFNGYVHSDLPCGSSLSSSAALETAAATILEAQSGTSLDGIDKALLCQKAEHEFANVPCGIMDQFAVSLSKRDHLLLLDCRDRSFQHIPFSHPDVAVVIANTNVSHSLADGEYATRRRQCEEAARVIGVDSLRDASWPQLEMARNRLSDEVFRRARHVICEIERTSNLVNRLRAEEWTAVAALLYDSHESLKLDFEVSCPELDLMVEIAQSPDFDGKVYGSRMTGGGFGGSTVSLVHRSMEDQFIATLAKRYQKESGITPYIFSTAPAAGARLIDG